MLNVTSQTVQVERACSLRGLEFVPAEAVESVSSFLINMGVWKELRKEFQIDRVAANPLSSGVLGEAIVCLTTSREIVYILNKEGGTEKLMSWCDSNNIRDYVIKSVDLCSVPG